MELILENAKINWETNDREIKLFMFEWCSGYSYKSIADKLKRKHQEVILLSLHLDYMGILPERPGGIYGFKEDEYVAEHKKELWQDSLFDKYDKLYNKYLFKENKIESEFENGEVND